MKLTVIMMSNRNQSQKKCIYMCVCLLAVLFNQIQRRADQSMMTQVRTVVIICGRVTGGGERERPPGAGRTLRSGYKNVSHVQVHQTVPSTCEHLPVCKLHLNRKSFKRWV